MATSHPVDSAKRRNHSAAAMMKMKVPAIMPNHHAAVAFLLDQLHRESAEGEADHAVERIGLAGAHQIGELLEDHSRADPFGDGAAESMTDADVAALARRLGELAVILGLAPDGCPFGNDEHGVMGGIGRLVVGELSKPASQRSDIGVGHRLGRAVTERIGSGVVLQELAYLMRAGEPDAVDRMVGLAFGGLAVQLLQRRESGRMLTLTQGAYSHVPIDTLLQGTKRVDVGGLYDPEAYRAKLMRIQGMPMFLY